MSRAPRVLAAATALTAGVAAGGQLAIFPAGPAAAATVPGPRPHAYAVAPDLTGPTGVIAAGADLVYAASGRGLWSRDPNVKRPIASITKVMTALIVLRAGDLTRKIRVTTAAERYGRSFNPSEAGLHPGDVLTARQLMEGLLLPSGSDAAYLLATSFGPGRLAFVRKMNAEAKKLGMTRTHFANFDGLPWPSEHSTYSTPRDLMKLARAAMKYATFQEIVSQQSHAIAATAQHHHYFWKNTDLLLGRYRGAIGIKTGYTSGAGYCLLFEAKRGTQELLGVVLDSTGNQPNERFTAAADLLNWGFRVAGSG